MFEQSEKHASTWFHWLECAVVTSLMIFLTAKAIRPASQIVLGIMAVLSCLALFVLTVRYLLPVLRKATQSYTSLLRIFIVAALAGCLTGMIVTIAVTEMVAHGS